MRIYFAYRYFDCSLTFTHMFIFSFIHNDILRNTVCRATQKQNKKEMNKISRNKNLKKRGNGSENSIDADVI